MHKRLWAYFALLMPLSALVAPASTQELSIRTTFVDDRTVVVMPTLGSELRDISPLEGVKIEVSVDEGLRTYRASYLGRTYTAYADVSGPSTRFAFDPGRRRFQILASTIRVELEDYDVLGQLVQERGAVAGKAYPQLGFALLELPPETDPAEAVEFLDADPRVRDASVQFEPAERRPMILDGNDISPWSVPGNDLAPTNAKESLTPHLYIYASAEISADVAVEFAVGNSGGAHSDAASLRATVFALVPDESTADTDDVRAVVKEQFDDTVPELDAKSSTYRGRLTISSDLLEGGQTYYVTLAVVEGVEISEDSETLASTYTGFTLDSLKRVLHVCVEPGRGAAADTPDPLLAQQWHLDNTGQMSYADSGGVAGEDLGMDDVLANGPTGDGVKVAVVDSGMEICHPDLTNNVEEGASFNFNAERVTTNPAVAWAYRMDASDPFNFESTGGHGTSVAGLIAAAADNGIGGRGVAPGVRLRGYNMLNAVYQYSALLDSLGASSALPNSADVDVFNMSFGGVSPQPTNVDSLVERVLSNGVRNLRSGLGAIYVKAAGNAFGDCASLVRLIDERIGCGSSNGDDWNNLPYLIVVGAHNADGRKSSYSSTGANLWVSAPGGEYGDSKPSLLSVDQMGWDRGFGVLADDNPLNGESDVNPNGDYTGRMNGTSAAAATVSGAVAVLLEEAPDLTWRDVKHLLAKSARRMNPGIEKVDETIGTVTRTLRPAWTENAAGYWYHNWYGFGALDLDDTLELAEDYSPNSLGEFRQSGWFDSGTSVTIPDNDGTGVTQMLNVTNLPSDASIEAVILEVDVSHDFPNDLGIHLVSPQRTRSVINQVFNETLAVEDFDHIRWRLLSNAFYGETPGGNWQIEVFDGDAEDTGSLDAWRLRIYYGSHPTDEEEEEIPAAYIY